MIPDTLHTRPRSSSGGGPAPADNGSKPIHTCPACGTMYSGGTHTCH